MAVLFTWCKVHYVDLSKDYETVNQPLWGNILINIANKPAFYCKWEWVGINYIQHIIDNKGTLA
jgi:hypothetical protein